MGVGMPSLNLGKRVDLKKRKESRSADTTGHSSGLRAALSSLPPQAATTGPLCLPSRSGPLSAGPRPPAAVSGFKRDSPLGVFLIFFIFKCIDF